MLNALAIGAGSRVLLVAIGVVAAVLTWTMGSIVPSGGLDGSWHAALYLALERHLRFGPEIDFTFGPLGFLSVPALYDPVLGAIAWAFTGTIHAVLCVTIVLLSRRGADVPTAILLGTVGVIASIVVPPPAALSCLLLLVTVWLIAGPARDRRIDLFVVTGVAVVCAITSLVKLNDAVVIVLIGASMSLGSRSGLRAGAWFVFVFVLSLALLWVGLGQPLGNVADYAGASIEIVLGYASAMVLPSPERPWETVALIVTGLVAAGAVVRTTRGWRPAARLAFAMAFGGFWFLGYRYGFIRQPAAGFFAAVLIVVVVFLPWRSEDRHRRTLALGVLGMALLASAPLDPAIPGPLARAQSAVDQLGTILSTDRRVETIESARASLREGYRIPQEMLDRIGEATVHIAPYETAVAWAYPNLRWSPLPVFQAYQAYTTDLDARNAARYASDSGPTFVLRKFDQPIDSRSEWFESPRSMLALACHYRQVLVDVDWQLLSRGPDRCSAPRAIARVTARPGDVVPIPLVVAPNTLVIAQVHGVASDPIMRLQALVASPAIWTISLTDVWTYRLLPGTADGPLIVASTPALGYLDPYSPRSASSFRVYAGPDVGHGFAVQPDEMLRIDFEAVSIAP